MKTIKPWSIATAVLMLVLVISSFKQAELWTKQQLLEPADLAKTLNDAKAPQPFIYSVGPQAVIKNSIDIGPGMEPENIAKLKLQAGKLPKTADIVIYCGCCPFANCPNIRPAFRLLKEMKFKNYKVLNLPHNVRTDWISKGYPTSN